MRETQEEFGITPRELIPITVLTGMPDEYCDSQVFLCTDFDGTISCDGDEIIKAGFLTAEKAAELVEEKPDRIFLPFALSVTSLLELLQEPSTEAP